MADRKKPEVEHVSTEDHVAMNEAKKSVAVNQEALTSFVLYDSQDKLAPFYQEVKKTVERLGVPDYGKVLTPVPKVNTNPPNILDVKRWLDSLDEDNPECDEGITYLLRLLATLESRMPPQADKEV